VATQQGEGSTHPEQHPSPEAHKTHHLSLIAARLRWLAHETDATATMLVAAQAEARSMRLSSNAEGPHAESVRGDLRTVEKWCNQLAGVLHNGAGELRAQAITATSHEGMLQEGGGQ
jgi:hypothetical protein